MTVAAGVMTLAILGDIRAAHASPQDPIPPTPSNWSYVYGAQDPGRGGTGSPAGGDATGTQAQGQGTGSGPKRVSICGLWRMGIQACDPIPLPGDPAPDAPAPPVSPGQLAQQAWRELPIPAPEVATAPPRGSDGLVGLPEWFWVTNWDSHQGRVEAGGVWAQVTARPLGLTIDPGTGRAPLTCDGPGTSYDRKKPAQTQRSDCSYTYDRSSAGRPGSAYRVTVTVTWGGTWTGSGGAGGTLPVLSRSTTFPLRVAEGQTVTEG